MKNKRVVCALLGMHLWGCQLSPQGQALKAPDNYKLQRIALSESPNRSYRCEVADAHVGTLDFPSKFEGSDRSRDTLNVEARARYKTQTAVIDAYAKRLSALAKRLHRPRPVKQDADCFYASLHAWAAKSALGDKSANGTGKAVRKWTLATLASHYLVFQDLNLASSGQRSEIESWFASLAEQVRQDYSDRPLRKINNHDYWAGWSVMLVAVILDDRELYSWSLAMLKTAIDQINADGLLPNEMRRASLAFSYHNFAIMPLASMAAFAYANGDDLTQQNQQGLFRLASNILQPDAQAHFAGLTGVSQSPYKLEEKGHLSWVPALLSISANNNRWTRYVQQYEVFRQHAYSRLGGSACQRFLCPVSGA